MIERRKELIIIVIIIIIIIIIIILIIRCKFEQCRQTQTQGKTDKINI